MWNTIKIHFNILLNSSFLQSFYDSINFNIELNIKKQRTIF